jgi:rhodanese-related sulfurtransferase
VNISVTELSERLAAGDSLVLLDVREADELVYSRLPGVVHIPMGEVDERLNELPVEGEIVVICRAGVRSARVQDYLLGRGFGRVLNLTGGMNAWVERYGGGTLY